MLGPIWRKTALPFALTSLLSLTTALVPLTLASTARAQEQAMLVADSVALDGQDKLRASGNVEVLYQGNRLRAKEILYDRATDRLLISGPITLGDGAETLIVADQADLAADLSQGVLQSARMVLNRQLQLSSSELLRIEGRYNQLGRTLISSCKICSSDPTPLWEIRARHVVHDQLERQIYFDSAQFRFGGVPLMWLPYLRMPDPTLKRTRGVLRPDFISTTSLGTGFELPYFIPFGDSRDLTVTPRVATKNAYGVKLRYREAFNNGMMSFTGSFGRDEIVKGKTRAHLFGEGFFNLPQDFTLRFNIEMVSDESYLLDYDLSGRDRLESQIALTRTQRDEFMALRLVHFHSIRAGDRNSQMPALLSDVTYIRRSDTPHLGGETRLKFSTHSHRRSSHATTDSDNDGVSDGRDMARVSFGAEWQRNWQLPAGVLASLMAEAQADFYHFNDEVPGIQGNHERLHGAIAAELRWPLVRSDRDGASHLLEPILQVVWSPTNSHRIPDEDSTLSEFDEGNLFHFSRYPGHDRVERGLRANVGVSYTRYDPNGWSSGLTFGRILSSHNNDGFGPASGLERKSSDWLLAAQFQGADGLGVMGRMLFNNDLKVSKSEIRLDWQQESFGFGGSYVWMLADPLIEQRLTRVSELVLDGRMAFNDQWEGAMRVRYDFEADRAAYAGLGLIYRNECLQVDASLSRRFTSSSMVRPDTRFKISFDLLGFGGSSPAGAARPCRV